MSGTGGKRSFERISDGMKMRSLATALCACSAGAGAAFALPPSTSPQQCFDASILAEITAQVPSDFPNTGDGYILMSWPYFIDLEVKRVLEGHLPEKEITALSVQHTYWRTDLGVKKWWVRRIQKVATISSELRATARPHNVPPARHQRARTYSREMVKRSTA
jgi:hypothetical protein